MAILKFDAVAERADDPKMQRFLQVIGGGMPDESKLKNVARDEQPFLPELAWAYFSAYKSVLYGELEGLLLVELRKILDGRDADRDATEKARSIMQAVNSAREEEGKKAADALNSWTAQIGV
jgi:hypothetical protein